MCRRGRHKRHVQTHCVFGLERYHGSGKWMIQYLLRNVHIVDVYQRARIFHECAPYAETKNSPIAQTCKGETTAKKPVSIHTQKAENANDRPLQDIVPQEQAQCK